MAREYNYIYKRLVDDETDIVGHIAYSLYKKNKVEYIDKFKKDNGRGPDEGELKPFHDVSCMDMSLKGYKELALDILLDFLAKTIAEATDEAVNKEVSKHKENYQNNLREVIKPLVPLTKARRYGEGIVISAIGAFVFALLVAAIAFIIQFKGTEFKLKADIPPTTDQKVETVVLPVEQQP